MTPSLILIEALKGAITGAIVGWVTNWLAVWMLFHPRRQWRIFGVAVPLTPGLVVKNHARLADAIGRAISRDLLAPETILAHLERTNLSSTIEGLLNAERNALLSTNESLAESLGPAHAESLVKFEERATTIITSYVVEVVARMMEEPAKWQPLLANFVQPFLDRPIGEYLTEEQADDFCAALLPKLDAILADEKSGDMLRSSLESLVQDFPGSTAHRKLAEYALDVVRQRRIPAAIALQDLLARHVGGDAFGTAAQDVMARRVHAMIVSRFSFAAMLVTEKKVREILAENWPQFTGELQSIILGENLTTHLADGIGNYATTLVDSIPDALRGEKGHAMAAMLSGEVRSGLRNYLGGAPGRGKLHEKIQELRGKSLADLLATIHADPATLTQRILRALGDWCVQGKGQSKLKLQATAAIHYCLHKLPASRLARLIPDSEWHHISQLVAQAIERRTLRILPTVLSDHLDLAEIVKNKIMEFETTRLEQIIYEVSGRELKGIVWFGAVLGVIVGAAGSVVGMLLR
ncbi:DUF445 family protein [Candidatus Sumerlaeota bacterium]|nr:DUF445 family protein [Candidatus Sumerlaeota bacterium]